MAKIMTAEEAIRAYVKDGDTILCGGFRESGTPKLLIDEIIKQGQKNLTLVNNDGGDEINGCAALICHDQVKKFICSWCAKVPILNEERCIAELELCPQGSLVERIRCGGYGLGGVLTPVGLGTEIETRGWGKRMTIDGKDWLFHDPIHGNVTLIMARRADTAGNLIFHRGQRAFSKVMAYASDVCICLVEDDIEPMGSFDPDDVDVPGVLVDVLVPAKEAHV